MDFLSGQSTSKSKLSAAYTKLKADRQLNEGAVVVVHISPSRLLPRTLIRFGKHGEPCFPASVCDRRKSLWGGINLGKNHCGGLRAAHVDRASTPYSFHKCRNVGVQQKRPQKRPSLARRYCRGNSGI